MSKETLNILSEALVAPIPVGSCLDHCMRALKYAAGLEVLGIPARVEIVQAVVEGQVGDKKRRMLHCWVEVQQSGRTMVMDATANTPITEPAEYYQSRKPSAIKRYSPATMHQLLTRASRAEWFDRTPDEVAQYTGTPSASGPSHSGTAATNNKLPDTTK